MKKIFALLVLTIALVSCYDDYVKDFDYTTVYFPNVIDIRTVVVGEGMKFKVGVAMGGVMENKINRNVSFTLDNSLITPGVLLNMKASSYGYIKSAVSSLSTLQALPSNYYTLSNNSTIVIEAGQHSGTVTLKADSAAFLADAATINPQYVLPFSITAADVDSILAPNRTAVIGIKYENMLFGNYLHGGITTVKDAAGTTIQVIPYYTTRSQGDTKIWNLTTVAPNAVVSNGYSDKTSTSVSEIVLTLSGTDITVSTAAGSTNTYQANGASTYNGAKLLQDRKILLNYMYVSGANTYYCQDTLTFRNRIRDGVNEWQDENPSHYSK